jgi:DNA-directed RNA polymerase subunit H (RpoH/RPB5)
MNNPIDGGAPKKAPTKESKAPVKETPKKETPKKETPKKESKAPTKKEKAVNRRGNRFIPYVVYKNLFIFMKYANISFDDKEMNLDQFSKDIQHYGFISFKALDRHQRRIVIFVVNKNDLLVKNHEFNRKAPDFTKLVHYFPTPKITKGVCTFKDEIEVMVISEDGMTTHVCKKANEIMRGRPGLVIHDYNYTLFNEVIPEGLICDEHIVLSDEEVVKLIKFQKFTKKELPKISRIDPQVIWIAGRPGDIIQINRTSETSIVLPYYRVVK